MNNIITMTRLILLVLSVSLGQGLTNSYQFLEFENALPSVVLKAQKTINPATGKVEIRLLADGIEANQDIATLEAREESIRREQDGCLGHELAGKLSAMNMLEAVKVSIHLKYPPISYLDKTNHSTDELRANSIAAAAVLPITSLVSLAQKHALPEMESRGPGLGIAMLNKFQLQELKSDPDIGSIEEVREESRLSPDLSTLAASAYNPGAVPSNAGTGIRVATFETGLTSGFLSCLGVIPMLYDANVSGINADIRHANGAFRCLVATAPLAGFYHRRSLTFDGSADVSYLIDNSIQSVSMSISRGGTSPYHSTNAEFLVMDDFAYRYPYPVYVNPSGNAGYQYEVNWQGYNGISVGNVRHTNNSTYEMADCTQAKNPPPIYGSCISGSGANCSGDREMPYLLVPGIPYTGTDFASTCLEGSGSVLCGTSWSAPIGNGIAADVLAADSRMLGWPEKVRATMVLTAQNVDGGDWASGTDGRDGAGVVSGSEAVAFAQSHTSVSVGNTAVEKGMGGGSLVAADFSGANKRFNYLVPNPKPSGKHLRVVLTWDSNPIVGGASNPLSDVDLIVQNNGGTSASASWDGNVEVVDVSASSLTAGSSYYIDVDPAINRIPASGSRTNYFYYMVAWYWVKDHAN